MYAFCVRVQFEPKCTFIGEQLHTHVQKHVTSQRLLGEKSPAALPPMDELRTARKSNISSSYALNTYKDFIWRKIAGGNAANGNMEKNRTPTNMFSISQASTTIHKSHCQRCKNLLTASGVPTSIYFPCATCESVIHQAIEQSCRVSM